MCPPWGQEEQEVGFAGKGEILKGTIASGNRRSGWNVVNGVNLPKKKNIPLECIALA